MPTTAFDRNLNETFFAQLENPTMEKKAVDSVNSFTRLRVREDGVARRVLPFLTLSNDELDRQYDTDQPAKVVDMEPNSPAAISLPYASLPDSIYIKVPRYRVLFDRVYSPRFTKDIDELRTYIMDVRQVLSDNSIKDMLAEEDRKFFGTVNNYLVAPNTLLSLTGTIQWPVISGGITRDTVREAFKVLPRSTGHLEVHTFVVNNVTIQEFMKWGRDEMGGDFSQDVMKRGWVEKEFMNARMIITIKRNLVPDDSMYYFGHPEFMGKNFSLNDVTMYVKRDGPMIDWYAYETIGGSIANVAAIARADFVP